MKEHHDWNESYRDGNLPWFRTRRGAASAVQTAIREGSGAPMCVEALAAVEARPTFAELEERAHERTAPLREALAAETRELARPAGTYACCGGVKALGHEPGCEEDIRRRVASGRYER